MHSTLTLRGRLADVHLQEIYPAELQIRDGKITAITRLEEGADVPSGILMPGFVDSHVHIESSLLVPSAFARLAVVHGTVATVSDPHEIANVCGQAGVDYMIENGKTVPFKFFFGAPSCVPATVFETAGARLDEKDVEALLQREEILYLSEMMNFPGVLNKDPEVMAKIEAAHRLKKPVDGHAPGLRGETARQYIAAGISTDHECFTAEEALDKLQAGMKIIIREGSAAKNFEALIGLLADWPEQILFCSDDKHPDSLVLGHINQLCARAVAKGLPLFSVLQAACVNPVEHYRLPVGLLSVGDPADFIRVEDLKEFRVMETYINGERVAENGKTLIAPVKAGRLNQFAARPLEPSSLAQTWKGETEIPVIGALDGQLITEKLSFSPRVENGTIQSDTEQDVLKIVVVNRYHPAPVAISFIHRFGLKRGALASSVAHDSHNIVAVGADDESLAMAINAVIAEQGGLSVADAATGNVSVLGLPVAGLMSVGDGYEVAEAYTRLDAEAKALGTRLSAPFMTLSFMALLVIPHLKLSDKGIFDGDAFRLIG